MNWASVVPGAITGVVGIAGIGGSILSAKLAGKSAAQNLQTSISADNERARLADKRQVYVRYQVSLTEFLGTVNKLQQHAEHFSPGELIDLIDKAYNAMASVMSEMMLAAPAELAHQASDLSMTLWHFAFHLRRDIRTTGPDIGSERMTLYCAMRADLGELVESQPHDPAHPSSL